MLEGIVVVDFWLSPWAHLVDLFVDSFVKSVSLNILLIPYL